MLRINISFQQYLYIAALGGRYNDFEPLSSIAMEDDIPYGQEYLSLLARKGAIDAHKEGKTWLSTRTAIKAYLNRKKKDCQGESN